MSNVNHINDKNTLALFWLRPLLEPNLWALIEDDKWCVYVVYVMGSLDPAG